MSYTDLQNRAFTQIAYMDLQDKYTKYCQKNNTKSAPMSDILSSSQRAKLNSLGISDAEINSWSLSAVHDTNKTNGFYACVIETSPGNASVAFRGSEDMGNLDNLKNDWVGADVGLVNSTCTNQQKEVDKFLSENKGLLNSYDNLSMTGHSLGGNLAEYATIVSYKYGLDDKIKQCVSMDGPGFSNEFILKYRKQIEKMSDVMQHPRWSFVGTMLNDLPGVKYDYVQVSNEANKLDDETYTPATRHDTKYLVYDDSGNLIQGEQDDLSKATSVLSEGVDHLPILTGNAVLTVICSAWIGVTWAKENMFDNGKITPTGVAVIAGAVTIVSVLGIGTVIMGALTAVVSILAVLVVAFVGELIYDLIMNVVEEFCNAVGNFAKWTKEKISEFKNAVVSWINKAGNWLKNLFGNGKSANVNPQIVVDTYKLRNYAQRLQSVNRRIATLDSRLDSLYWSVGLKDLWNLMQADILTGYSWRLNRCVSYLNDTANDFDNAENSISGNL